MTTFEQQIWTSAFAYFYGKELEIIKFSTHLKIKDISGFTCAEQSDEVLEKFREAMICEDKEYLIPIKEKVI